MSLVNRFKGHVAQVNLFTTGDKLLLAVSGGVDSVVLCELCQQAGYDFVIAHCNFNLRGPESDRDEQFVKKLGAKYGKEVLVKHFDTKKYASDTKLSIQEAARELRYSWFTELLEGFEKPALLITAHHADDNIETVLMNFFRGTGLYGLAGIPAMNGKTRRPLLPFSKKELLDFASQLQLEFVEDSSNADSHYTRNYFRNELIPSIAKVFPQVEDNLRDNIGRFREIQRLYRYSVDEIIKKICRVKGKEIHIPVKQLLAYRNRALIYEIISVYGFQEKQIDEVLKLAASESGKYITSPNNQFRIIKHRHWFIIAPVFTAEASNMIIESSDREIRFALGTLEIATTTNHPFDSSAGSEFRASTDSGFLDTKQLIYPLLLRKWKTGDYFYPLGMKKKKKLARFFIDQKLSKTEKENVWVIESGNRIAWVVGYRIDERFRITDQTRETLLLRLIPSKRSGML